MARGWRRRAALSAVVFAGACVNPRAHYESLPRCAPRPPNPSAASPRECLEAPAVHGYMKALKLRVLDRWVLPPGVEPDQLVRVKFRLGGNGRITCINAIPDPQIEPALVDSVLDAIGRADPFPPLQEGTACLAEVPIVGSFANPERP